jgi:hypothetical protein
MRTVAEAAGFAASAADLFQATVHRAMDLMAKWSPVR